jgi:hypothetical protein
MVHAVPLDLNLVQRRALMDLWVFRLANNLTVNVQFALARYRLLRRLMLQNGFTSRVPEKFPAGPIGLGGHDAGDRVGKTVINGGGGLLAVAHRLQPIE